MIKVNLCGDNDSIPSNRMQFGPMYICTSEGDDKGKAVVRGYYAWMFWEHNGISNSRTADPQVKVRLLREGESVVFTK